MHSEHALSILKRERHYSIELNSFLAERDATLKQLRHKYTQKLLELEVAKWSARMLSLKQTQTRKYKHYIFNSYETNKEGEEDESIMIDDLESTSNDYEVIQASSFLSFVNSSIPSTNTLISLIIA